MVREVGDSNMIITRGEVNLSLLPSCPQILLNTNTVLHTVHVHVHYALNFMFRC